VRAASLSTLDSLTATYVIIGAAGVAGLSAYAVLILVPAWTSYGRTWERLCAAFLTLFVLAAFAGSGVLLGLLIVLYWDQILELLHLQNAILLF
jgi:hypothetical protein